MNARCTGDTCKELKTQTAEEAMKCTKPRVVEEDIDGCKSDLLAFFGRSHELNLADDLVGLSTLPGDTMVF